MATPFRYRLLFVGVNAVPEAPSLHAAVRDAEAMSERFHGWGFRDRDRHRLLVSDNATSPAILDAIGRATSDPAGLDLLLIYWAGHLVPGRRPLLATSDQHGEPGADAIELEALTTAFGGARKVAHRVLILDACNGSSAGLHLRHLSRGTSKNQCIAVLASGSTVPFSREHRRRGYLTGSLLEQLPPGGRGLAPTADLLEAARAAAASLTGRLNQPPFLGIYGSASPLRLPSLRQDVTAPHVHAA